MSGLVDCSVFAGPWPFRALPNRTPVELKAHLQAKGVTEAWVCATEAILYADPMQANEPLFDSIKDDPFFVTFAVLNLTQPTWQQDAESCVEKWSVKGFKLFPNYHSTSLDSEEARTFANWAIKHELPVAVQIRMEDERSHHPLMKVSAVSTESLAAWANEHKQLRILICGGYGGDLRAIKDIPNVVAEISAFESGRSLHDAVSLLGDDRILFASHCPLHYFDAVAAKLDIDVEDVTIDSLEKVRSLNAIRFLGRT